MYTDTHCHLELIQGESPDVVAARARSAGVTTVVTVGVDLASSAECVRTAAGLDGVWATVGIHPNNAIEATDHVLRRLAVLARHPKVVGIGESGLDWFREGAPRVRQEESFREHIRLAKDLDKTLVIHNRDAHDEVIAVLTDERPPERVVFHCFSGDAAMAELCAERGWYVSFAGNVTFRNAPELREAAAAASIDLLVAETDSPYLSPHPYRGKPNEPARVVLTVAALAELHGLAPEEMAARTTENAQRLFALPASRPLK
ncbi:MAG: TatD family hydrolase [Actinomycetota bacterium]|nr:TatD family hydrolase [Actinomycetota bacterium]